MPTPTDITDLSTTAGSNSPAGSEAPSVLDDHIRALGAIIKQNASKGADIASGSTITIPNAGSYFVVTGTTGITGINDAWNGRVVYLKFSGILTLTNSASLILFGSNITTAAGDSGIFVNESAGVWRCLAFTASTGGTYITASSTDTLTNKTIVVANNTITTAASGNLAATELDAALAELDSDKADKVVPAADVNIAVLDGVTGNLEDGGKTIAEIDASIAAGTAMVFFQAAAPTGWTKSTTHNDKALRVVSGSGGGSGGTAAFSTPAHTLSGGATTLSTAQMPSHTHTIPSTVGAGGTTTRGKLGDTGAVSDVASSSVGSSNSHSHSISGSITTPQYIDVIVCTKD